MEHKYQWSIFTDATKTQQYVVRCDDILELTEAITLVREAIRQEREEAHKASVPDSQTSPPATDQQEQGHFCTIHNQPMKLRTSSKGKQWYDHRWQDEDKQWHQCNGQKEKTPDASNGAHVS